MMNHWLRKKDYRERDKIKPDNYWISGKSEWVGNWSGDEVPPIGDVVMFDKELSSEEVKQLSTVEIVGDSIVFEGDSILLKGNVTIVGDLTIDGNLTITDCMTINAESEVNIIDCTFSSMNDRIFADLKAKEDQKFLEAMGIESIEIAKVIDAEIAKEA